MLGKQLQFYFLIILSSLSLGKWQKFLAAAVIFLKNCAVHLKIFTVT